MKYRTLNVVFCCLLGAFQPAHATDEVEGQETIYESYNGVSERCVRISPMPGGTYDDGDRKDEEELCSINFYSPQIALCPKIWGSSAAVMIYDISSGRFSGQRTRFQERVCAGGQIAKYAAHDDLGVFKFSMNQQDGGDVYSPSPLLYYHFSRYLDTALHVPVSVWRTMDKSVLLNEVALTGVSLSGNRLDIPLNSNSWNVLVESIRDPSNYVRPGSVGGPDDLFTADGLQVYGFMNNAGGRPYGEVIIGTSDHRTDTPERYQSFSETAVIRALGTDAPLIESIENGLRTGNPRAIPLSATPDDAMIIQMAYWMREISEIVLLDSIFSQDDRIGNIDYREYYYWLEGDEVHRRRVRNRQPGEDGIPTDAVRLFRSRLNDNDSAVIIGFSNYMLEQDFLRNFRHFDAGIYQKLQELAADFRNEGPTWQWLSSSFGLSADELYMIGINTRRAAATLRLNCEAGQLRFDLNPKRYFRSGDTEPDQITCS